MIHVRVRTCTHPYRSPILLDPNLSMSCLYDSDMFDSMAVINSELWNNGDEEEETGTTLSDLLPDVHKI